MNPAAVRALSSTTTKFRFQGRRYYSSTTTTASTETIAFFNNYLEIPTKSRFVSSTSLSFSNILSLDNRCYNNNDSYYNKVTGQRSISTRTQPLLMSATKGEDIVASLSSSSSISEPPKGRNVALAMGSLANADAVCFDVDSTVIAEEGIDVLADFLGQGEAVAALTKKAMEGDQKFQDALKSRLELMKPSRQAIEECLNKMPLKLTPGIEELIEVLTNKGIDVYFVSGGFRIMIEPVAMEVCVAKDRIFANTIFFDENGNYAGFDPNEPTSRDMGKPKALELIKAKNNYKTMVMVGDGATDAQAKPPADAFIGFGGIVVRPAVLEAADWFVTDFKDMTTIVEKFSPSKLKPGKEQ